MVIWYRKDRPIYYTGLHSLEGYKVGGTIGYSYGQAFDKIANTKLNYELAATDIVNLKKLALGRISAFPCDKAVCSMLIQEHLKEDADVLTYAPEPISSEPTYFLVSKKHKEGKKIIDKINEGLELIGKSKAQ